MKRAFYNKLVSVILAVCMLILSLPVVFAEEGHNNAEDVTPVVTDEPLPSDTPSPTPEQTQTPTDEPTPDITENVDITPGISKEPEISEEPSPTEGGNPTPVTTPTGNPTNAPTLSPTKKPTPTVTKKPTPTLTGKPSSTPSTTPYATVVPPKEEDYYPAPNKASDKSVVAKSPAVVKVDGIYDDVWNEIEFIDIKNVSWGESGASGKFKVYWDKQALYMLVEVEDFTPDTDSERFTRQDCVEVFLNENGTKPAKYGEGDCHFKINSSGEIEYGHGANEDIVEYKIIPRASGYVIEISVKFVTISPVYDQKLGFDVRINDSQGKQYRDYMIQWSDTSMYTYTDLSKVGTLFLR